MKSWKTNLAIAWVAQFFCIAGFSVAFPFMPFYVRELGVTDLHQVELWTGILNSGAAVSMALVSPVWGLLADRRGRKLMVLRSTIGGAIITAAMALSGNVQQLFILRVIQGMLTGTIPAFMTLVASFSPPNQAGFSLGLMQMAVYLGSFVGPLIGGVIADQLGYQSTFIVTGAILLFAGILVYFFIQESFSPPDSQKAAPGLGECTSTIVHSLPVLGAIVALSGFYLGNTTSQSLLPLYVESLLPDSSAVNTNTGAIYGIGAIASALAAVSLGRLSDRIGHRKVLIVCSLGAMFGFVGQAVSPNFGLLLVACFVTGLFTGGMIPSANAALARDAPREQQGAIYGVSNSANAAGRAIGPMLGAAVATSWGLRSPFVAAAAVFGLVSIWIVAVVGKKEKSE
jgi:MFS transporter, DHA1 family, multidrug resistance protein